MAACRDCHQSIRFVRIVNTGNMLPVDPVPDELGNVWAWPMGGGKFDALVLAPGDVPDLRAAPRLGPALSTRLRPRGDAVRYMPHAATCSARDRPRRPRSKPRADEPLF